MDIMRYRHNRKMFGLWSILTGISCLLLCFSCFGRRFRGGGGWSGMEGCIATKHEQILKFSMLQRVW